MFPRFAAPGRHSSPAFRIQAEDVLPLPQACVLPAPACGRPARGGFPASAARRCSPRRRERRSSGALPGESGSPIPAPESVPVRFRLLPQVLRQFLPSVREPPAGAFRSGGGGAAAPRSGLSLCSAVRFPRSAVLFHSKRFFSFAFKIGFSISVLYRKNPIFSTGFAFWPVRLYNEPSFTGGLA